MTILATVDAWRADGQSLNTLAYSIERVAGMDSIPPKRTSRRNVISQKHGRDEFYDEFFGPKRISLTMWIAGNDEDGNVTHADGQRGHIRTNLAVMNRIFGKKGSAISLARDVYVSGGTVTRTADAIVRRAIPYGGSRGLRRVRYDLDLDWPFWHSAVQSLGPGAGPFSPTIGGDAPMAYAEIDFFNGTNARLTYTGSDPEQYIEINGSVPASGIRVNTRLRTVTAISGGANELARLRLGTGNWLELPEGSSPTLTLTGGGTATFKWYDAWFS